MKLQNFEFCSIKPEYRFVNNIMYFRRIGPRSSLPASLSEPLGRGSYFRTFLARQETFDSCLFISNHFIPLWRNFKVSSPKRNEIDFICWSQMFSRSCLFTNLGRGSYFKTIKTFLKSFIT
uniref:Uncharacterized protein n=1 Tax=Cacopsylla melanoneura TaxID=428564 RepID=A0A8D8S8X0_9HEMI